MARRADVEEITPGRFIIRDPRAVTILKTEGEVAGQWFTLTSWRREGLFARLRERGLTVSAFEGRVAALPWLPAPQPLGAPLPRPLTSPAERLSVFDHQALGWRPADPAPGRPGAALVRPGQPVRRRKGRGAADYYLAFAAGRQIELRGVSEDQALLAGYAQAAEARPTLHAALVGGEALLPQVELPSPHRALLRAVGREEAGRLLVDARGWPFAQDVFHRLGIQLLSNV